MRVEVLLLYVEHELNYSFIYCLFHHILLHSAHDAVGRFLNEFSDVVDFVSGRHLVLDLQDGIFYGEITHVNQSVGVSYMTEDAVVGACLFEDGAVHAFVACGVAAKYNVWWHIFLHSAAALHQTITSDVNTNLAHYAVAEDSVAVNLYTAAEDGIDTQHTAVLDMHVVAKVGMVHQTVIVADAGTFF